MNVQDRYARSISSSHLEVTEFTGDIDALIAAGWCKESLSTLLWRLRVEYDAVDGRQIEPMKAEPPPDRLAGDEEGLTKWRQDEAERIARDLTNRRMTARALAMVHMRSLYPAKEALARFVMAQATRQNLVLTEEEERRLCGRVLNNFLDPLCKTCCGVKFRLVPGTGRLSAMPCEACDGAGRQQLKFTGNTDHEEVLFTRAVLGELDRKMDRLARLMKRFLRELEVVS